jgi:hypothetical protein
MGHSLTSRLSLPYPFRFVETAKLGANAELQPKPAASHGVTAKLGALTPTFTCARMKAEVATFGKGYAGFRFETHFP